MPLAVFQTLRAERLLLPNSLVKQPCRIFATCMDGVSSCKRRKPRAVPSHDVWPPQRSMSDEHVRRVEEEAAAAAAQQQQTWGLAIMFRGSAKQQIAPLELQSAGCRSACSTNRHFCAARQCCFPISLPSLLHWIRLNLLRLSCESQRGTYRGGIWWRRLVDSLDRASKRAECGVKLLARQVGVKDCCIVEV